MRARLSRLSVVLSAVLTIIIGLTTLLGLLLGDVVMSLEVLQRLPLLADIPATTTLPTSVLAAFFVRLAVITIAMTFIIGVVNLLFVNGIRVLRGNTISARLNSIVVFGSFTAAVLLYLTDRDLSMILLEDVQVTIESALAGLLFFVLVAGGYRILQERVTPPRILFVISVLAVLLAALPLAATAPLQPALDWLLAVPVDAGARGILLGIALATVVTGFRILIGQDRSYGE